MDRGSFLPKSNDVFIKLLGDIFFHLNFFFYFKCVQFISDIFHLPQLNVFNEFWTPSIFLFFFLPQIIMFSTQEFVLSYRRTLTTDYLKHRYTVCAKFHGNLLGVLDVSTKVNMIRLESNLIL